ncbi:MAG: alkaline phosphatase family protein [Chloroflexi bacterium]|jgi:hypothetical protein|nr:alkaline phosphatase family protein [Chloroflexota bacterium]
MQTIAIRAARAVQFVLGIIGALLGTFYSAKYTAITRRLGLPRVADSAKRGFVIVEIDGLSYPHLQAAMSLGYAPYIQRLIERDEFALHQWKTGLPCTTPAAQAGIMYGNNDDIPAFRWYDKAAEQLVVCKLPGTVKSIQDRISANREGILKGGSSVMNMFDGDASLSMFTLAALHRKRFFESVRGLGFLVLFILNPFRTLKMFALAIWEYLTDVAQSIWARWKKHQPLPLEWGFAFLRVFSNVILREIQTFAVLVDIYRGAPAIYTTYYGYDELAHRYGPLSKPALHALRAIDSRIRQIDNLRRRGLHRAYDLYVLSDHGMTPSVPFTHQYGQTLGEFIRECLGGRLKLNEAAGTEEQGAFQTIYLMEELRVIESNLSPPLTHIPRKLRQLVARRVVFNLDDEGTWDPLRRTDIVVRNSGSLSHVYLNVTPRQMDISEVAVFYPNLMSDLAAHEGIWLVVGREQQQVVILSKEGNITLDEDYQASRAYTVEGQDPLAALPNSRETAAQLNRVARFAHSGDLMLIGSYDPTLDSVCCFEQFWACHGGIGGPQESAFMLHNNATHWNLDRVAQATEIYPLFAQLYAR